LPLPLPLADDIFISYSRKDGNTYVAGLADELRRREFSCFFDKLGTDADGKDDTVAPEQMFSHWDNSGATKDYHLATDAHLGPVKPSGTTGKSLIVLNPGLSLNQRVVGSSPTAPTKLFKHLALIGIRTVSSV
jgi:hypothetical protein